jgi:predicted AAA+ superfamily ATPase
MYATPMINRNILNYLSEWRTKENRKPLVLRGARQVGKSCVVRELGRKYFQNVAELNLEENPQDAEFVTNVSSPKDTLKLLSAKLKTEIIPGKTLLFIDEIQKSPESVAALRFWYEKLPELHVIAAGSLLDLTLRKLEFSMPVGRIEYCYLGPLCFSEFLCALGDSQLASLLHDYQLGQTWPESIHLQLLRRIKDYWIVGGMPEAVAIFCKSFSYGSAEQAKRSITSTYRDDFGKYGTKINIDLLRQVYSRVPTLVGQRAKYVLYSREHTAKTIAEALQLLSLARVITKVKHSAGNGLPLGAEVDEKLAKHIFVDIGLQLSLCDLDPIQIERAEDLLFINNGSLAEQFIGQHLLYIREPFYEPELYYWERSERNAAAELDYLMAAGGEVVPIEVKAGAAGHLKSLQIFCEARDSQVAVRFSSMPPRIEALSNGTKLLSLPMYFVEELLRLLRGA